MKELNEDKRDGKYHRGPLNVELIIRQSGGGKRGLEDVQPIMHHVPRPPRNKERDF
jgi:hypothetical protein